MTTYKEYKRFVLKTCIVPTLSLTEYLEFGLIAEVGEIFSVRAKYLRGDKYSTVNYEELILRELADVEWFITACNLLAPHILDKRVVKALVFASRKIQEAHGFSKELVWQTSIGKITKRIKDGTLLGDGSER